MFGFLTRKKSKKASKPSIAPVSVTSTKSEQHSSIQRELIRVVLKDTMRLHGIPLDWLQNNPQPSKVEPISVLDRRQTLRPQNAQFLESSLFGTYDKPSSFQATDVLPLR